ncbi:hypothetical protein AOQ84DRAFT_373496 [Glonium stellatum]|uniref:Uncharacterized protein n=1 Tax=Glonium stellatum TaxID=574774 RepID=A0A8E2F7R4_9PEZI|nr:hypothetical protein AOQ84DRAFT_373496 [Glonium stellatum]
MPPYAFAGSILYPCIAVSYDKQGDQFSRYDGTISVPYRNHNPEKAAGTGEFFQFYGSVASSAFTREVQLERYDGSDDQDDEPEPIDYPIDSTSFTAVNAYSPAASANPSAAPTFGEADPDPTQSSHPTESPGCQTSDPPVLPTLFQTDNGAYDYWDLFYTLRRQICSLSCSCPDGIPAKYIVTATDGSYCEISIGVSNQVDVYIYTGTPNSGREWAEC